MKTIYNAQNAPAVVDGFTVAPGLAVVPGPTETIYIDPVGGITRETPKYAESFASGMLITLPMVGVLVWRKILFLLKPAALDRFM
jgi:hypothetical protein